MIGFPPIGINPNVRITRKLVAAHARKLVRMIYLPQFGGSFGADINHTFQRAERSGRCKAALAAAGHRTRTIDCANH